MALIKIEDNYRYFIAKIEHANFVDGIELVLKEGLILMKIKFGRPVSLLVMMTKEILTYQRLECM